MSNLVVSSISDSRVHVTWMPPDMPRGESTSYNLKLVDYRSNDKLLDTNIPASNQTSYSPSGLGNI